MIKREFQEAGIVTSVQPAKTGTFSVPVAGTPATAQGPPPTPLVESARSIESVPKPHFPPGDAVIAEVRTTAPQ
jgi:hypothetical protein